MQEEIRIANKKVKVKKKLRKEEEHACYILITCKEPSADGKLSVEMKYEGDPVLASYLLKSAQGFIEEEAEENVS